MALAKAHEVCAFATTWTPFDIGPKSRMCAEAAAGAAKAASSMPPAATILLVLVGVLRVWGGSRASGHRSVVDDMLTAFLTDRQQHLDWPYEHDPEVQPPRARAAARTDPRRRQRAVRRARLRRGLDRGYLQRRRRHPRARAPLLRPPARKTARAERVRLAAASTVKRLAWRDERHGTSPGARLVVGSGHGHACGVGTGHGYGGRCARRTPCTGCQATLVA